MAVTCFFFRVPVDEGFDMITINIHLLVLCNFIINLKHFKRTKLWPEPV